MKRILFVLFIFVVAYIAYNYYNSTFTFETAPNPSDSKSLSENEATSSDDLASPNLASRPQTSGSNAASSPQASGNPAIATGKGLVKGKLCYPSEFLPAGKIIAKRISDNQESYINYPGTENGGQTNYTFELDEGDYYLKYQTASGKNGYHTDVCPTGLETTCGMDQRKNLTISVKSGQTSENINLCDFYYKPAQEPKF